MCNFYQYALFDHLRVFNSILLQILRDELGPKIAKLKEERAQYLEYQRVTRELEHCKRIYTAWKYMDALHSSEKANENVQVIKRKIEEKQNSIKDGEQEIKNIEEKVVEITNKRNAVSSRTVHSQQHF